MSMTMDSCLNVGIYISLWIPVDINVRVVIQEAIFYSNRHHDSGSDGYKNETSMMESSSRRREQRASRRFEMKLISVLFIFVVAVRPQPQVSDHFLNFCNFD